MQPDVFRANAPQLFADVNRVQCMTMGVSLADVFDTLQIYLGSLYVNDFNLFGRTWQVIVQADAKFRNQIDAARQLKVRNGQGGMVPIGALADVREVNGPLILTRYNMYPAAAINGSPAPGVSSRQAIDLMEQLADQELLPAMRCEWTEMAYLELQAGNTAMIIFALAVVMVFLVLAAQYESWSLPLAVILVVPMCLLSAIAGVTAVPTCLQGVSAAVKPYSASLAYTVAGAGMPTDINIFTQIGFVVLVGLASKNAILIVEFAKRQREGGMPRHEAALAACQLRLRPIVMTSFAFILGVVAAVDRPRRRRRDAPHPGHGRVQRHVGRDPVRHLPHARLLHRDRLAGRHRACSTPGWPAGSASSPWGSSPWGSCGCCADCWAI